MVRAGRCGGYRRTLKLKGCSDASCRPSAASRDLSHMSGRMTLICGLEGSRAEGGSCPLRGPTAAAGVQI